MCWEFDLDLDPQFAQPQEGSSSECMPPQMGDTRPFIKNTLKDHRINTPMFACGGLQ